MKRPTGKKKKYRDTLKPCEHCKGEGYITNIPETFGVDTVRCGFCKGMGFQGHPGHTELKKVSNQELVNYIEYLENTVQYLFLFAPLNKPYPNMDPTFYLTGDYKGDLKIYEKLKQIKEDLEDGVT